MTFQIETRHQLLTSILFMGDKVGWAQRTVCQPAKTRWTEVEVINLSALLGHVDQFLFYFYFFKITNN